MECSVYISIYYILYIIYIYIIYIYIYIYIYIFIYVYIYAYLLYSVEPGKPTFCSASFVSQADMNFASVSVLLKNVQTT